MDNAFTRRPWAKLPFRRLRLFLAALAMLAAPVLARAQAPDPEEPSIPPEPTWPSSSTYYEARITPGGYALYVPFFIPREGDPGEGGRVEPPWMEGEVRRPTDRDPVGAVGRFELRTREEVIPGEFIQVYRPAVYELDSRGDLHLVEPEAKVTLPKVRIVLERVWVSGLSSREGLPGTEEASAAGGQENPAVEPGSGRPMKQPEMAK